MALFNSIKKKVIQQIKIKKRVFDPEKMSVEDISLPISLRRLDLDIAKKQIETEFKTYKSLGYKDKPLDQIKYKEYHSYQVGVILRYLKEDNTFFVPNINDILPSMVTYISKKQLHIKVFGIVFRYDNIVDKEALQEELVNDVEWTPLDMAYLLYYLSLENRVIPKR
jgi:hypothetical protein